LAKSATIEETISFAEKVLAADPGKAFRVEHQFNYFNEKPRLRKNLRTDIPTKVLYTGPGKARIVELILPQHDHRAGNFPQHNSPGPLPEVIEIIPSLTLEKFRDFHSIESLMFFGFQEENAILTKKRIAKIANQFANLSAECFRGMMCISVNDNKRDYSVWTRREDNGEIIIAYINPEQDLIQFIQTVRYDDFGEIIDLKHVVFELGSPIVINQSCYDCFGNLRNIAHVGITGSTANSYHNSLERFDDGSIIWTSSDYKDGINISGSAALKENGEVMLIEGSNQEMAECSARNLGAEGIDIKTCKWTGKYSAEACVEETKDKFIIRREYKTAVRKQVYQIIDGACIPGPEPIFNIQY
jgi:hypothetical protein